MSNTTPILQNLFIAFCQDRGYLVELGAPGDSDTFAKANCIPHLLEISCVDDAYKVTEHIYASKPQEITSHYLTLTEPSE